MASKYANLPEPEPGHVWATHRGIEGVAQIPKTALPIMDGWTPVGPGSTDTPDAGATTTSEE